MSYSDSPIVSIIVPVYGVEKYIKKCIESLLYQTCTDFEVIVVDDSSPDKSILIATELVGQDRRFKFFSKPNGGLSDTRNFGLRLAEGKYVAFLDSDDFYEPDFLAQTVSALEDSGADICFVGLRRVYEDGSIGSSICPRLSQVVQPDKCLVDMARAKIVSHITQTKVFRRKLFTNIEFTLGILFEDMDIMYRLVNSSQSVVYVPRILFNYLQRKNSIMSTFNEAVVTDRINVANRNLHFFTSIFRDKKFYLTLKSLYVVGVIVSLLKAIRGQMISAEVYLSIYNFVKINYLLGLVSLFFKVSPLKFLVFIASLPITAFFSLRKS